MEQGNTEKSRPEQNKFSKGDIVELSLKTGKLWGIYIGLGRIVYVSALDTNQTDVTNEGIRSRLPFNSKTGIIKLSKIQDLTDLSICTKNNSLSSHWNFFSRTGRPEKIAERALVEIGQKTSMSSLNFVLYCRYGSNTEIWMLAVFIAVLAVAVYQGEVQAKVDFLLREHYWTILILLYLIFAFCIVLSIVTHLSDEPVAETKWRATQITLVEEPNLKDTASVQERIASYVKVLLVEATCSKPRHHLRIRRNQYYKASDYEMNPAHLELSTESFPLQHVSKATFNPTASEDSAKRGKFIADAREGKLYTDKALCDKNTDHTTLVELPVEAYSIKNSFTGDLETPVSEIGEGKQHPVDVDCDEVTGHKQSLDQPAEEALTSKNNSKGDVGNHVLGDGEGKPHIGSEPNPGNNMSKPVEALSIEHKSKGIRDKDSDEYSKVLPDPLVKVIYEIISYFIRKLSQKIGGRKDDVEDVISAFVKDFKKFALEHKIPQKAVVEIENFFTGDHKAHKADATEGETSRHPVVWEKNPGGTKFIPVDTFTLKHLPMGQRDIDLYEYIKAVADLTVKVQVKKISPHRPEFWPKTNNPYPFYQMGSSKVLRTGSGLVYNVYKYTDGICQNGQHEKNFTQCWCKECQISGSPKNVWWEFDMSTARHLVFDDIEANDTVLRLFYDSEDSSMDIVNTVSEYGIEQDWCKLKCVTCDKNLGGKLLKMWEHFQHLWRKVSEKYNYRSSDQLTFMVSHPGGCAKQVSVGEAKRMFKNTKCTSLESSGAILHCVGSGEWSWSYNHRVEIETNLIDFFICIFYLLRCVFKHGFN